MKRCIQTRLCRSAHRVASRCGTRSPWSCGLPDREPISVLIPIVVTHPRLGVVMTRFVTPLGDEIEEMIGAVHHINAACIGRIRVKDSSVLVPVKHADALTVRHPGIT